MVALVVVFVAVLLCAVVVEVVVVLTPYSSIPQGFLVGRGVGGGGGGQTSTTKHSIPGCPACNGIYRKEMIDDI